MATTICYVAGKSAGHILPCLTEAQTWQKEHAHSSILFFATIAPLDRKILAGTDTNNVFLPLQRIPYRQPWLLPLFAWHSAVSLVKSFYHLWHTRPKKVVSMGGLVSIPVCLAAKLLRIPIELHELNVMPGKTIKFLAPLAHKIHVCFEESKNYLPAHKCSVKSYPIRFAPELKTQSQTKALKKLGLDPSKKTIFVLGGSQGSLFINGLIKNWVIQQNDLGTSVQLIHQTGARDTTDWKTFYKKHNVRALVFDYHEHIATLYIAADIIVCRAGAGTLFEIAFFDKQCITIPLEATTTNHQVANGHAMARLLPDRFTCLEQKIIENNSNTLFTLLNKIIEKDRKT